MYLLIMPDLLLLFVYNKYRWSVFNQDYEYTYKFQITIKSANKFNLCYILIIVLVIKAMFSPYYLKRKTT